MKKNIDNFFAKTLCIITITLGLIGAESNAATRATAVRTPGASRRPITTTATTTKSVSVNTTTTAEPEPAADSIVTPEPTPEPVAVEQTEPIIIENKSVQFNDILSANSISSDDSSTSDLAEQIRKQRAAFDAQEASDTTLRKQQEALKFGKNVCDSGLRGCMIETCGKDFTKCALDGDTMFGEKLNKCRLKTTCTGEEFRLFTTEIKADRDFNVRFASYNAVIDCGNDYKKCITTECGATFGKCLGKNAADRAIKKCATIAKNCTEQDSGLASRFGIVIGKLRETAEKDVKADEKYLYDLRELMRKQCQHLGAMFDERSLDCVYTVNFFAGENQSSPIASRKLYAGDSFICNQEWFGINATTFKENAYRETRSQTAASSAMMGAGLGTAAGLITSGAIGRAMETQAAKKDYKKECESQGGKLKDGECVKKGDKEYDKIKPEDEDKDNSKAEARQKCKENNGTYLFGKCIGGNKDVGIDEEPETSDKQIVKCKKQITEKTSTAGFGLIKIIELDKLLTKEEAMSITENWNPTNPKMYSNSDTIQEHEKDACDALKKLNAFIKEQKGTFFGNLKTKVQGTVDNAKKNITDRRTKKKEEQQKQQEEKQEKLKADKEVQQQITDEINGLTQFK